MKSLRQWVCDSCGELIERPEDGWVEWVGHRSSGRTGFRICHHQTATPEGRRTCRDYDGADGQQDLHLNTLLGPNGLLRLTEMIYNQGAPPNGHGYGRVADMEEFLELLRRLQVPYYEEARQYASRVREDNLYERDFERLQVHELQAVIAHYRSDSSGS